MKITENVKKFEVQFWWKKYLAVKGLIKASKDHDKKRPSFSILKKAKGHNDWLT